MTLLEKLDALKAKNGDNNSSLARKSGIPYTTIDGLYKKGYANMKLSTLQALADYFGVSIDYLAKDDNDEIQGRPTPKDEPEREVFARLFTTLTPENRQRILDLMQVLVSGQAQSDAPRE